jgi:hypothetical protein
LHTAAICIGIASVPVAARAQGYATVTVTSTGLQDTNLFSTAENFESDYILRVGPVLEAGYLSQPTRLTVRYGFEAERYRDHPALDKDLARQNGLFEFRQMLSRRLIFNLRSTFVETRSARELNLESGLTLGLAVAQRAVTRPGITYEINSKTQLGGEYEYRSDVLAGGVTGALQYGTVALVRQLGPRTRQRLDYRFRHFAFGDNSTADAHIVMAGLTYDLSRRAGLEVSAGPRRVEGSIEPEIAASMYVRLRRLEFSASYARSQTTVMGRAGTLEVQRGGFGVTYDPTRRLQFMIEPSVYRTARTFVYGVDAQVVAYLARRLTFITAAETGIQEGTLHGGVERYPYQTVSVKLSTSFGGFPRIGPRRF